MARPSSEWRRGRQPPARRRSPRGRAERGHHRAPATSEAAQHTRATRARPPPRTTRSGAAHRRGYGATRAHLDLRRAPKQYLKHRCAGMGLTSGVEAPAPSCAPPPPLQRLGQRHAASPRGSRIRPKACTALRPRSISPGEHWMEPLLGFLRRGVFLALIDC